MGLYAKLATYSESQLDEIRNVYEFASFASKDSLIYADCTGSGATYACITGSEAFKAATGKEYDPNKGILNWKNKRITKEKAQKIHAVYERLMKSKGMPYVKNDGIGRLKILRLFASAFTFHQEENKDGEVCIVLENPRKRFPAEVLDMIINLTFRERYKAPETKKDIKACSGNIRNDCNDINICTDNHAASDASNPSDRDYMLIRFTYTKGRAFKITETCDIGVIDKPKGEVLDSIGSPEFMDNIHYMNGFYREYDYSKGNISTTLIREEKYRELLAS